MYKSKYFSEPGDQLSCSCCGRKGLDNDFLEWLDGVREEVGFPLQVTSGFRCVRHPIEAAKSSGPGAHTTGRAVDIAVWDEKAIKVMEVASRKGCVRMGVSQNSFIHLDLSENPKHKPNLWTY